MPKVKRGNNRRAKQQRRGPTNDTTERKNIRKPDEEEEMYARVIQHFGQGNVEVLCSDDVKRLCVIRKKFRGRRKRSNEIKVNSVLLVGRRKWEVVAANKRQKVDLLYVYSKEQVERLKKEVIGLNPKIFYDDKEGFEISKEENIILADNNQNLLGGDGEEIDIDDI